MKTHDYTNLGWAHDYTFDSIDGGMKGSMCGWGHGIKKGDFLILENDGGTTRYKVTEISYYADPPDMWKAKVRFAPRSAEPAGNSVTGY
jgi:hypothetical protein